MIMAQPDLCWGLVVLGVPVQGEVGAAGFAEHVLGDGGPRPQVDRWIVGARSSVWGRVGLRLHRSRGRRAPPARSRSVVGLPGDGLH